MCNVVYISWRFKNFSCSHPIYENNRFCNHKSQFTFFNSLLKMWNSKNTCFYSFIIENSARLRLFWEWSRARSSSSSSWRLNHQNKVIFIFHCRNWTFNLKPFVSAIEINSFSINNTTRWTTSQTSNQKRWHLSLFCLLFN